MPTGPEAPAEHVILDENIKAENHDYYYVGYFKVSPDHKLVAYTEDARGNGAFTLYVIDAENGTTIEKPLVGELSYSLEWVGNDALVYITRDDTSRADKVWMHKLFSDQSTDLCIYHEDDDMFSLDIYISESKKYIFVKSESPNTNSIFYLDILKPEAGLKTLARRLYGINSKASQRGHHFFLTRTSEKSYYSELVACPVENISDVTVLLPHKKSVTIRDVQLFNDHIVVREQEGGLTKLTVYDLPAASEALELLRDGREISFIDPIYSVKFEESEFTSNVLRFSYSSMRTPTSVYDYDMDLHISILKKIDRVLGGFNASNYMTERKWAVASDGTRVPISILYKGNLAKLDGSNPLLLDGYGSFGFSYDPAFVGSRLSLVDRGFIYAIAHVRGGGEMGVEWHESGNLLKKNNSFTDFITCVEYLVKIRYCSKEKVSIIGSDEGGMLVGAVLNMRPDLIKAVVAQFPFVDVLTTMLDPSIPGTASSWEEWGNPRKQEYYFYMKSYSPIDNIKSQNYPNILVTGSYDTPDLLYHGPAKYVAKLREMKTDDNVLLFRCEVDIKSYEEQKEDAFAYAFLLKALDMIQPASS
ncbi:uncharacterized protein M6B38_278640 [Iris pallida]|uniref:Prolyl endopeptidase n=1 Tax=Iris pallida TaxID=29817 RepID=A0AAX6HZX7_IRIPA|nr:uncharacterized protein M6B38_278640 [Iris pallida]